MSTHKKNLPKSRFGRLSYRPSVWSLPVVPENIFAFLLHQVTSKKNGNSIFLPAAGYLSGTQLDHADEWGNYWSSSPYKTNSYGADDLYFFEYYQTADSDLGDRYYGKSVRPVSDKTE